MLFFLSCPLLLAAPSLQLNGQHVFSDAGQAGTGTGSQNSLLVKRRAVREEDERQRDMKVNQKPLFFASTFWLMLVNVRTGIARLHHHPPPVSLPPPPPLALDLLLPLLLWSRTRAQAAC